MCACDFLATLQVFRPDHIRYDQIEFGEFNARFFTSLVLMSYVQKSPFLEEVLQIASDSCFSLSLYIVAVPT